eukprot:TRINITY_DN19011_c0_g1_i1.p1 TRINITY_DN19011_c0_g1~~TRINITY_DN19011_c0_g1_i1.p1  ORF type:complete len:596 (-),score=240.59 TRINITY_DN19011_c0_g1_i1:399-2138(-)
MADPAPAAPAQAENRVGGWIQTGLRILLMYYAFSLIFKFKGSSPPVDPTSGKPTQGVLYNAWRDGTPMNLRVYLSLAATAGEFTAFGDEPVWQEDNIFYSQDAGNVRELSTTLPDSLFQATLRNETVFAHVLLSQRGTSPDPSSEFYSNITSIHAVHPLNRYLPRKKDQHKKNLLSGEEELVPQPPPSADGADSYVSYWKPNVTVCVVHDLSVHQRATLPPQIADHLRFDNASGAYQPIVFFNEFWLQRADLVLLNSTLRTVPVHLKFEPISLLWWQFLVQMDQSLQMQMSMGASEGDDDEFKRMLSETPVWLLALTVAVSLLHTVFDFLAFKNDIVFWKNRKSMAGLSTRTLLLNIGCQTIIFLYLLDNDTSWMILISSAIGLAIEVWKIKKALIVEIDRSRWFPFVFKDRESYVSSHTAEYDRIAMQKLSYVLYPLIVCYAIYSLYTNTYKSWYSWVISSLTGCVYTFGFIMMCPQLYINYRLKSVAHLPWKTFMYKALNTFIDDLFAFIIKMPTLHRLACFRDDIIFLVYLYQRWIYRVDKSRVNEFGQGGDDADSTDAPAVSAADGATKTDKKND